MASLLAIEASPRKQRSASLELASRYLDSYAAANPQDTISRINLWDLDIPEVDDVLWSAKHAIQNGLACTREQAILWEKAAKLAQMFVAADSYVICIPMWNFSIPYKLKHFIDVITQSGITFDYSKEDGYRGLLDNKPVTLIYAMGKTYPFVSEALKLQKQHMEMWLNFIGLTNITSYEVRSEAGAVNWKMAAQREASQIAIATLQERRSDV
jgi:FMN-dependent NADH-azoreductase